MDLKKYQSAILRMELVTSDELFECLGCSVRARQADNRVFVIFRAGVHYPYFACNSVKFHSPEIDAAIPIEVKRRLAALLMRQQEARKRIADDYGPDSEYERPPDFI